MQRAWRMLSMVLLFAGVMVAVPGGVAADDAVVSTCTEAGFDAALATAQLNGGGTIRFSCSGTILFTGQKTITSNVTILGSDGVIFDGDGNTRLFQVNSGASLELTGLTLQNGNSSGFPGGAIWNHGTLTITASTFSGNSSALQAGAIFNNVGTLTITASTFSGNTVSNPDQITNVAGAIGNSLGTVTIVASSFSGNTATLGGVIYNSKGTLSAATSTFSGNSSANLGGAILNDTGTLTVTASTFSGNSSENFGGAIDNFSGTLSVTASTFSGNSSADFGGAILNDSGTLTVTASTFSGNSSADHGGAIENYDGTLTIEASTFSGNTAKFGAAIDGVFGTTTIKASTFSGNTADFGVAIANGIGTVSLQSTILANDSTPNCETVGTVSTGYNLSDDASCNLTATGDIENSTAVSLGPLQDNGGPTQTMALLAGSDALDAADCSTSTAHDQRGVSRPQGTSCDIGAVEVSGTVPVQIFATYNDSGTIDEGSSATLVAVAYGPAGASLDYDFDCDNNGSYETAGVGNQGQCTFDDNGLYTVGVQVTDGDSGVATDSTVVTVNNVAPTVDVPTVDSEPSDEGQSVVASASFTDPGTNDTHSCTVDYGDGSGVQVGTVVGLTCIGPAHIYVDDDPSGTPSDDYTVTIEVTDDDTGSHSNTAIHTVTNVDPVIESITTNSPVPQGHPVTITVNAADVGINDILSYSFDCDDDGSYEVGPQASNQTDCTLDPAEGTSTIGVRVEDDDLGIATDSVEVRQQVTLCVNYSTGALTRAGVGGSCGGGKLALALPAPYPVTLCIRTNTGELRWSSTGGCSGGERPHIVPDSGPLHYCESLWTGQLRVPLIPGQCTFGERAGVIPG